MTFYIIGPDDGGEGVYYLLTEQGEHLANHFCSHRGFAKGDLEAHRPERQAKWTERFGEYSVKWIGEDAMTKQALMKLNDTFYAEADSVAIREKERR